MHDKALFTVLSAAVLLMVATYRLALAQQAEQPETDVGVQSASCFSTHASGSGASFVRVCFSNHGNLVQFKSPAGFEHIRVGTPGEGYVVCSETTVHGFDAGSAESGFGSPTISQPNGPNTFPLTITRTTTDGVFQLRQTFAWDTTEKDVTITMTLTNRSSASRADVKLVRYVNGNVDNDAADDRYARDADAVWGWEDGAGRHGLQLTALTFATSHATVVETFANWNPVGSGPKTARGCGTVAQATPTAAGDFVGRVTYSLGTIAAGSSRTVQVLYGRL